MLKKIVKQPLLHFVLIGASLFLLYSYLNPTVEHNPEDIVVTTHKLQQLATIFEKKWHRGPTESELQNLIDTYVLEEVYYREALSMQMDKNDTVIRRRLRQKMEFLLADASVLVTPSDDELNEYFQRNLDKYMVPARYGFKQIYIDTSKGNTERRINAVEKKLKDGVQIKGDPTSLPNRLTDTSADRIDRVFGSGFSDRLSGIPMAQWTGPLQSGFGLHWVYLEQYLPTSEPPFKTIRDEILVDYEYDSRAELQQNVTAKLLSKYNVVVQPTAQ